MRMNICPCSVVLAAMLAANAAGARVPPELGDVPAVMFGMGNTSCAEFSQTVDAERKARSATYNDPDAGMTPSYIQYTVWTDGYLTAINLYDPQNRLAGHNTSHETRMRWLDKHCREYPLQSFRGAIESLHDALGGMR